MKKRRGSNSNTNDESYSFVRSGIQYNILPPLRVEVSHEPYFLHAYKADGTEKPFRCLNAEDAESMARRLWETGNWTRIDINSQTRYGV